MFSIVTTGQAMDHLQTSEQDIYPTQIKDFQSKTISKNPPEQIKAESMQATTIIHSEKKIPTYKQEKSNVKTESSNISLKNSTTKSLAHDIDLKSEQKTNVHESSYTGIDFISLEEQKIAAEKIAPAAESRIFTNEITQEQFDGRVEELIKNAFDFPDKPHSITDILVQAVHTILFHLLNLPTESQKQAPVESLKKEIQFLSEQIQKYNNESAYSDIDQMLEFIAYMNNFLKESHFTSLSTINIENLDAAYTTASTANNIFKNENIIFDAKLVPNEVVQIFVQTINDGEKLTTIKDATSMIHEVYDKDGSIDLIIKNWQSFMATQYTNEKNNQYYAAFMTFLLIFQDSILATTSILNETSKEFKVTDQLNMQSINYSHASDSIPQLETPAKIKNNDSATNANGNGYETNANSSLSIAVSSD